VCTNYVAYGNVIDIEIKLFAVFNTVLNYVLKYYGKIFKKLF